MKKEFEKKLVEFIKNLPEENKTWEESEYWCGNQFSTKKSIYFLQNDRYDVKIEICERIPIKNKTKKFFEGK